MFHCPKCDGQVAQHKMSNLIRQVIEWRCTMCGERYEMEGLKKAILTV
ncbi:MAG: hypothetical protein MN733_25935 [Nitrososphaera sp.]|nr:hypothetical protein [Nitrososphaera sp.]